MTHPHDDEALKQFLRQHRSPIPPASPDLEARIMQAVGQSTTAQTKCQRTSSNRRLWLVPSTIAASLLVALASFQLVSLRRETNANQIANMETFLENNWLIFPENAEAELFPVAEPVTQSSTEELVTTGS
jgi:hypothetical protein